jgi:hypothetical protein
MRFRGTDLSGKPVGEFTAFKDKSGAIMIEVREADTVIRFCLDKRQVMDFIVGLAQTLPSSMTAYESEIDEMTL